MQLRFVIVEQIPPGGRKTHSEHAKLGPFILIRFIFADILCSSLSVFVIRPKRSRYDPNCEGLEPQSY
ncbi:protein of unknown function [Candidatus Filomicrobium marinum]|nr:protein of unknown function [Candidatus Filomicrobium marinum]